MDRHGGVDFAVGDFRRRRRAGDGYHLRGGEGLVQLQSNEVCAGHLRGDGQRDTGILVGRAGEQGAGTAGVGHGAADVRCLFADGDLGFGIAGDQDLRAGDDFELAVAGVGTEIAQLVVRVVRIGEHEGVAGLAGINAGAGGVGIQIRPFRTHLHQVSAPAAGGREFEAELRLVVERDFANGDLQEDLRGHDVEAVEERLDGGVGPRRGTDDQAVQGAVGEDLHGRLEDVGLLVRRGRAVFRIRTVAVIVVGGTGGAGAVDGLRAVAAVLVDRERGAGHVVEDRQGLHELLGLGVHDLVDEDAFLVEGDRAVEDLDPVADLLRGLLGGGAGDDELETVDGRDLHGAGLLVVFVELLHHETEGREDLTEFFGDLAREDVLAGDDHARPLGARILVEEVQKVGELADVFPAVDEENGVRALDLDAGRGAAEERTDLVDDFLRAGEFQRIEAEFGFVEFRALADLGRREDAEQAGVFDRDRDAGVFSQGGERRPQVALRHRGVQVQGHEAADVGVDHEVESEGVRERRDHVHDRGAVEHDVHGDLFVAAAFAVEFFLKEDVLVEGLRLFRGAFVLRGRKNRSLDRVDLFRSGEIAGLLAVDHDHFFLDGLRKEGDVLARVLVVIKETVLVRRIDLVAFAVAGIVAHADGREETAEPGGIALFGRVDLFFRGGFDVVDFVGGRVHDHDVSDFDFAVFAGRDDGSLFDSDLIGVGVLQDHDLAVILVLQDLAFAELFDCGGRAIRLDGGGGVFRLIRRARHLG